MEFGISFRQNPTELNRAPVERWQQRPRAFPELAPVSVSAPWPSRKVKILEHAETMGDGPTSYEQPWEDVTRNSGLCNVVLRPFRMFSLGQRVQPATMIGFKQIEFFDHAGYGRTALPLDNRTGLLLLTVKSRPG